MFTASMLTKKIILTKKYGILKYQRGTGGVAWHVACKKLHAIKVSLEMRL
jgi:hypothetical protein